MAQLAAMATITLIPLASPLVPVATLRGQSPETCAPAKTALVLAGGGARGFAHIGVLRTLDSLGVHPDIIVGSSVGAIMGGLYASGYSGLEIDSLMRVLPIASVLHVYEPRSPAVMSSVPALAVWENDGRGYYLQTGSTQESEVNAVVNALMLRGNLRARGDFDHLRIPLRVVAADLSTRSPVVIGTGDLARAVRASAAIPFIFPPVRIDGKLLFDGGVADNTPVRIARALGAQRSILSWVPSGNIDPARLNDPRELASAIAQLVFPSDTSSLGAEDILIRNPTDGFNPLDLSPSVRDTLVHGGLRAARTALAGRCIHTLGDPAAVATPTRVGTVNVPGENTIEGSALRSALGLRAGAPLNEDSLRTRLLELGQSDAYRAVWLMPHGSDSTVGFDIEDVRTGRQVMLVGLAYDNDYGGRIWGGFADRRVAGFSLEGSALLDVSKYRTQLRGTLLQNVSLTGRSLPLYASVAATSESVRQFRENVELESATTHDAVVSFGVRPRLNPKWTADFSAEVRTWSEPGIGESRSAFGGEFVIARTSDEGQTLESLEAMVNAAFQRVEFMVALPFSVRGLEITPNLRAGWGTSLPLQHTFSLGGTDGFAGFVSGSRRGSQEFVAGVALDRALIGPIYARGEVMTGAVGNGNGFLRRTADTTASYLGRFVTGGRIGFEVRTAALNIRVEQGYNDAKRNEAFIRIGRWF